MQMCRPHQRYFVLQRVLQDRKDSLCLLPTFSKILIPLSTLPAVEHKDLEETPTSFGEKKGGSEAD